MDNTILRLRENVVFDTDKAASNSKRRAAKFYYRVERTHR